MLLIILYSLKLYNYKFTSVSTLTRMIFQQRRHCIAWSANAVAPLFLIFTVSYFLYRSLLHFFLRKKLSENEANQRTGIKNLPEERHREIHCCCLKPCRDNLAYRCMFDQHSGCKAHARTHKCYRYCRNCKYQVERII